jgi:hypothetical protein
MKNEIPFEFYAIPKILCGPGSPKLDTNSKILYGYLWGLAQGKGKKYQICWPENPTLALIFGCSTSTISKYLTQLRNHNLIEYRYKNSDRIIKVNLPSQDILTESNQENLTTPSRNLDNGIKKTGHGSQDILPDNIQGNIKSNIKGNIEEEQAPPLAADLLPLTDKDEDYIEDFTYYWRKLGTNLRDHYQRLPRDQRDKLYKFVMDNMKELNSRKLELTTVIQNKLWTIDKYNQWFDQNLLTRLPSNVPVEKKESSFILG